MAKMTVTVDNDLEDIELTKPEKAIRDKPKKEKKEKKTKKEKTVKKDKENKKNYFSKLSTEIKLVTWPTKKTVLKYSFATIMMIVLLAVFFIGTAALFDLLYGLVQGWIG